MTALGRKKSNESDQIDFEVRAFDLHGRCGHVAPVVADGSFNLGKTQPARWWALQEWSIRPCGLAQAKALAKSPTESTRQP